MCILLSSLSLCLSYIKPNNNVQDLFEIRKYIKFIILLLSIIIVSLSNVISPVLSVPKGLNIIYCCKISYLRWFKLTVMLLFYVIYCYLIINTLKHFGSYWAKEKQA